MTAGDLLLACLRTQGVRDVFGMPGTQNLPIYDAIYRCGGELSHHLIRHEQNATLLANGYARATGRVGVALTVPGPGATNAATGIGDAYTDCVPVLLITGGFARDLAGRDRAKMFHGLDQQALFAPITRYFGCPQQPEEIPGMVEEAFGAMLSGRPGPAVLEIAPDLAAGPCDETLRPAPAFRPEPQHAADPREIAEAADRLVGLARPLVLVGQDVVAADATGPLLEVIELLGAPVLHTRLGKGALDDRHPLVVGNCRSSVASKLTQAADGVLAIGVRFTQIDMADWRDRPSDCLIQVDRDAGEIGREFPVQAGVVGDLNPTLRALATLLRQRSGSSSVEPEWAESVKRQKQELAQRPAVPVLSHIREALPEDGICAVDVTSLGYRAFDEYPVFGPRQFLYPCHYVTLGFGFPAALGAKIACPDRPVVALCGDGGFLMTCMDLALAVESRIPLVSVVVADRSLTAIKGSQVKHYEGRTIATEMHVPDFVALARSFGAYGERAENVELIPDLIRDGLGRDGPTVIEVPMAERVDEIIESIPWLLRR